MYFTLLFYTCVYVVILLTDREVVMLKFIKYFIIVFLLLFVLVLGPEINGAKRWVSMGGLSFQPSDFAKIMLLIFMSRQISKYRSSLKDWKGFIWHL